MHGPSSARLVTDAPQDNMGQGAAFSPTDLTATSLGVCMLTTMAIVSRRQALAVELAGTSVRIRKHMTTEPPRRIAEIEADVELPLPSGHASRAILEEAALSCPVARSLHPEVRKSIRFHWAG